MQPLFQSPFLQALGYAITNSLWQAALLWIVVVLLNSFFKFSSSARCRIAAVAQLFGFAWFIITLQFYYVECSNELLQINASSLSNATASLITPQVNNFRSWLLATVIKAEQLLPYLSLAYLCLLIFLSFKWMRNYQYVQHIKNNGLQKADVNLKLFVKEIAALLNIKQEIKIYLSSLIKSPLTIGFIKPIILLPVASINHLTTEQTEAIILHELAHIKRADYVINLLQSVIEIALFFNPFTQLLSKIIKKERENSCDDWVLQFQYNPSMYAEALLQIAFLQTNAVFAMHAAKGDLLSRVKRMIYKKEKTFNYRQQLIAFLLMTGILSSVAWFQPAQKNNLVQSNIKAKQIVVEPITAKLDNPFFNPAYFLSKPLTDEINKAVASASVNMDHAKKEITKNKIDISKIAPIALEQLKNLNIDFNEDELKKANADAQAELAKVDWNDVKKDGNFLIDTAMLASSIRNAFEQNKKAFNWDKMKRDFAKAKDELNKLSADKSFKFLNDDKVKAAWDKAFAAITKIDFLKQQSAALIAHPPSPPKLPLPVRAPVMQKRLEQKQEQLEKLQEKIDSIKNIYSFHADYNNTDYNNNNYDDNGKADNWQISAPVYIENPSNNENNNLVFSIVDKQNNRAAIQKKLVEIRTQKNFQKKSLDNKKQTIQIISKNKNGNDVSITIEIL
ncbi:MAG: M56 family metallopeptidase [Chitinophagaceae bacterium]